jgi:hypothetical protein
MEKLSSIMDCSRLKASFVKQGNPTNFNWKAVAEWKTSPASWTVVDCVQQQLDILTLLYLDRARDWQFCACIRDNSSTSSDDAVYTHACTPEVLWCTQYCALMGRALQEDRENETCRWHFALGPQLVSDVAGPTYPPSYSLFLISCADRNLLW